MDYNEAIRLKPDYADALYNRADLLKTKGDRKGAAADYRKYLDLGGGVRDGDQSEVEQMICDLDDPSTKEGTVAKTHDALGNTPRA